MLADMLAALNAADSLHVEGLKGPCQAVHEGAGAIVNCCWAQPAIAVSSYAAVLKNHFNTGMNLTRSILARPWSNQVLLLLRSIS